MASYRFTNKAVEDITKIWNYTVDKWSENQADIYYTLLIATCEEVATNPNIGKDYSNITSFLLGIK
jgi:toxin ParE1/3/4